MGMVSYCLYWQSTALLTDIHLHSLQLKMRIIDIRHRRLFRFRKLHGVLLVRKW